MLGPSQNYLDHTQRYTKMAQFNKHFQTMLGNNEDIYEVTMLGDQNGNIINSFGDAANIPIAAGQVTGYSVVHKFGLVDGTNSGNLSTIWSPADTSSTLLYTWDYTPGTVVAVSTSGDDTNGGSGAQTIVVEGLDANYNEISDTLTMAGGTNTAASSNQYIVVHRAFVASGATNVGKISINAGATKVGEIAAGYGQTLMSVYTVPAGHTAYLSNLRVSSSKQTSSIIRLMVRPFGGVFRVQSTISLYSGTGETQFVTPLKITEKSNIDVRITGGTNNTVSCDFDMVLVEN